MTAVFVEEEPQTQAGVTPPHPPARLATAVDDPEKPRCADCGHKHTDHIDGVRCLGKLSFNTDCTCKTYRPKAPR